MTDAPERIWYDGSTQHARELRWSKPASDIHPQIEYIRADAARSEREALKAQNRDLEAELDRLREAITWASVITSHGMGLSTSEERTLHSLLTSALKGDQT